MGEEGGLTKMCVDDSLTSYHNLGGERERERERDCICLFVQATPLASIKVMHAIVRFEYKSIFQ